MRKGLLLLTLVLVGCGKPETQATDRLLEIEKAKITLQEATDMENKLKSQIDQMQNLGMHDPELIKVWSDWSDIRRMAEKNLRDLASQ